MRDLHAPSAAIQPGTLINIMAGLPGVRPSTEGKTLMRRLFLAFSMVAFVAACNPSGSTNPHIVFFTADSAQLDDSAKNVIADAAVAAQRSPGTPVVVAGFADPTGGPAYNRALSEARAQIVADALRNAGVVSSRISVQPRGPVKPEGYATESRRVEIQIGM